MGGTGSKPEPSNYGYCDGGCWHRHVHALVSRGGWTRDWQWVPVAYVDEHTAELLFRHKVMRLLQDVELLSEERAKLLLSWRHTGFSVHNRVRVEPEDQPAMERLARYIMRPPISLERMQWSEDGDVFYQPKGGHDGRARQPGDAAEVFDPAEFSGPRDHAHPGAQATPRQVICSASGYVVFVCEGIDSRLVPIVSRNIM